MLEFIDHTCLLKSKSEVLLFLEKTKHQGLSTKVASLCVEVNFVSLVRKSFPSCRISCVNPSFPGSMKTPLKMIEEQNTDELDLVFPREIYKKDPKSVQGFMEEISKSSKIIKLILETSEFELREIPTLTNFILDYDIDFIKTSTGTSLEGASLKKSSSILKEIKASGKRVGFKASGGIRTREDFNRFYDLYLSYSLPPNLFRIGSSSLAFES